MSRLKLNDEQVRKKYNQLQRDFEEFSKDKAYTPDQDDPDLKRMLEAFAVFSARSQLITENATNTVQRQLLQQYLSPILKTLPMRGILQCKVSRQLADFISLPKYTTLTFNIEESAEKAFFRTEHDLFIFPGDIQTDFYKEENCIVFTIKTYHTAHYDIEYPLHIYIDYNNYIESLNLHACLKKNVAKASVAYNKEEFKECDYYFDLHSIEKSCEDNLHPVAAIRKFFHFPQEDLYIRFNIPEAPSEWNELKIRLDLNSWPKLLTVSQSGFQNVFRLFTVPITNLYRDSTNLGLCDGTSQRHAVRHHDVEQNFKLHEIISVSKIRQHTKEEEVLIPGVINSQSQRCYEIDYDIDENKIRNEKQNNFSYSAEGETQHLIINDPSAFTSPFSLQIDAIWTQPWFYKKIYHGFSIIPYHQNIEGVHWEIIEKLKSPQENPLLYSLDGKFHNQDGNVEENCLQGFLPILFLMQKISSSQLNTLRLEDLKCLLKSIASLDKDSLYKKVIPLIFEFEFYGITDDNYEYKITIKEMKKEHSVENCILEKFLEKLSTFLNVLCHQNITLTAKIENKIETFWKSP